MGDEFYSLTSILSQHSTDNMTAAQHNAFCQLIEAIEGEENQ